MIISFQVLSTIRAIQQAGIGFGWFGQHRAPVRKGVEPSLAVVGAHAARADAAERESGTATCTAWVDAAADSGALDTRDGGGALPVKT